MKKDDVAAGATGGAAGAGFGIWAGHLGAAGLAIGGTAVAIPAAVVVGAPLVVGAAVGVGVWKVAKWAKKKQQG